MESKVKQLSKLQAIESTYDFLETEKSILWLGIGGWLLRMLRHGEIGEKAFWAYFSRAQDFKTFEELEATYSRIESGERWERFFNWDNWDLELAEWKAGQSVSSSWAGVDSWLGWFYVVLGLKLCSPTTDPLEPRSSLKSRLSTISGMLDFLEKEEAAWITSLRIQNLDDKIAQFRKLHQQAVAVQQEIEKAALRDTEISERKKEEYKNKFLERWRNSDLRRMLRAYGVVIDKTEESPPEDLEFLQINRFYPKEAFIEDSSVPYVRFGESHADEFIHSERKQLIQAVGESLSSRVVTETEEAAHSVEEAIESLQMKGHESLLVLTNTHIPHRYLGLDGFVGRGCAEGPEKHIHSFRGYFDEVPFFYLPIDREEVVFYVLALSSVGVLVQYQVEEAPGEPFDFQIEEVTQAKAEEMYAKRLDLRRRKRAIQIKGGCGE